MVKGLYGNEMRQQRRGEERRGEVRCGV